MLLPCFTLVPRPAAADSRADRMLRLLNRKPRGMTKERWLEQRREAARELGRLKDRRAVPMLLKIIARERFDVVLEIAIDALGEIGDQRAEQPLRKLLNDPSLDSYVRDAVAGALKKLGQKSGGTTPRPQPRKPGPRPAPKPAPTPPTAQPPADRTPPPPPPTTDEDPFGKLPPLSGKLSADLVARADRWEIVGGAANVRWDGATDRTRSQLALASRLYRQVERKGYGYTIDGNLDLGFRYDDIGTADASWDLTQGLAINPEIRAYPFKNDVPLLFGQLIGGASYGLSLADNQQYFERRFNLSGTLSVGGGPGYGRVIDVGPRLRLQRLTKVLQRSGQLSGSIDRSVAEALMHAWYQLRNRIGSFTQLGHTLDILRRAKLLTDTPLDSATVYRLVRVLDDPQLDGRPGGLMLRGGYGYARTLIKDADDVTSAFVYLDARLARQRVSSSLEGRLRFFYQMYGDPDFYGLSAEGSWEHFLYNKAEDPLGSLGLTVSAGLSNQPGSSFDDGGLAVRVLGGGSYTRYFSRGSRLVAALQAGVERGSPLVLLTLEARYGVAYGAFAPAR